MSAETVADKPIVEFEPKGPARAFCFLTTWGDRGEALWVSPLYNRGSLEKNRLKWGISAAGAQNFVTWLDRIDVRNYTGCIFGITDPEGLSALAAADEDVANLERELTELHVRLHKAKQRRIATYRSVGKTKGKLIREKQLLAMRDLALSTAPDAVAVWESASVDSE